jgi:membrane protein
MASAALRLYLHFITSYSASYGSVGAVIILLIWFYVTGLAFLIGAEVNSVIELSSVVQHLPIKAQKSKVA